MTIVRAAVAAAFMLGGIAMSPPQAEAMPVHALAAVTTPQVGLKDAYYRRYGWRRPFFRGGPPRGHGWGAHRFTGSRAK